MNSTERHFTIHHWPALQEWDVTPQEFDNPSISFPDAESHAPGLIEAISHCFRLAAGLPASVVIESHNERFELLLRGRMKDEPVEAASMVCAAAA
ncbi:MAG: hypothetical protein JWO89_932 [Verrucomicrobiaceae bacterium]|nr:hypothetical protein [Verrucomicrobiaceae bacterium]